MFEVVIHRYVGGSKDEKYEDVTYEVDAARMRVLVDDGVTTLVFDRSSTSGDVTAAFRTWEWAGKQGKVRVIKRTPVSGDALVPVIEEGGDLVAMVSADAVGDGLDAGPGDVDQEL